jgi:hypothetical protein
MIKMVFIEKCTGSLVNAWDGGTTPQDCKKDQTITEVVFTRRAYYEKFVIFFGRKVVFC